ncbi:MAG TPA: phosphosulfolactate synthase [Flavobacteriales bacterium]|nr:phosphosulfolactate synthase [Flavobacteriales bacterium]HRJ39813.1 phosphosulfolactate synthase [Flavobacteriales bacterium]
MMNFKLPYIPERPAKPRESGVTMMMDKGLSVSEAAAFCDSSAPFTDLVKFGFGTSMVTPRLEDKLKIYKDAGMRCYFGGTLFEAFIARGKFDEYRKLLSKYKLEVTEVSDGSIVLDHDEKLEYIQKLSKDFTVLSEVGSKEAGILISPGKWIKMMNSEIEAGAWKVIAEGRESGTVGIFRPSGHAHTMLINKITAKVPPEKIMWEAPKKEQQVWFIKYFGANVNLGNIAPFEVIAMECLRLGLRGDTFFTFLPDEIAKKIKHPEKKKK